MVAKATINDVAHHAGVSKRTVSRVINQSPRVNAKTRSEVERVIAQLNYVPSSQARGLASSRSYLLGLLYDDPNALVIHAVQKGILSECADSGYELVVHPCEHASPSLIDNVKHFVFRAKLDGVIILPPLSADEALASALSDAGIEYVRLSAQPVDQPQRMVYSSDRQVMQTLASHLSALGHRDIAVITGPKYRLAATERFEGLRDALAGAGIRLLPDNVLEGDFTFESGLSCATQILRRSKRPTAIFASNDEMAAGAIQAAHRCGVKVPQELTVTGYDDSLLASKIVPPLTTFHRPNEAMAAQAVRKLMACIEGRHEVAAQLASAFAPELVVRQSCGPVNCSQ